MRNSQSKTDSLFSPEKEARILEAYEELTPDVLNELLLEFSLIQRIYLLSDDAQNMMHERKQEFESNMFVFERLLRAAV